MNSNAPKSYRIKYDLHCKFENFFEKEIVVKNCYSEVHAKFKLGAHCEKKYGKEFDFIMFKSVKEENNFSDLCGDIFGGNDLFGNNNYKDIMNDILGKSKKK